MFKLIKRNLEFNLPVDPHSKRLSSVTLRLTSLTKYPWRMFENGGLSLIYATRRGGPGQGGTRMVIGQLGDSFPSVDGQGSCCQDVWSALDAPH